MVTLSHEDCKRLLQSTQTVSHEHGAEEAGRKESGRQSRDCHENRLQCWCDKRSLRLFQAAAAALAATTPVDIHEDRTSVSSSPLMQV